MNTRLSPEEGDTSLAPTSKPESPLANFGAKLHTFSETDRQKAVAVRRQKAAERRERAMTFPEFAREQVESDPARWFEPYEKARAEGEWRAPVALMDRIYGRPTQAVTMNPGIGGIDPAELEPGDIATLERLILERIQVERGSD